MCSSPAVTAINDGKPVTGLGTVAIMTRRNAAHARGVGSLEQVEVVFIENVGKLVCPRILRSYTPGNAIDWHVGEDPRPMHRG